MSLAQFIKDYINSINSFYDAYGGHIYLTFLFKFVIFYIIQSIKFLVGYILTFRWLNDFYSFKVVIPQLINSNFNSLYSSDKSLSSLVGFLDNSGLEPDYIVLGFLNGLFLSIPFSSSQILWLRRVIVEGVQSAIAGGLGIMLSQFLLNICVVLGFRFVIFPWYTFESIHYVFGVVLTLTTVYTIARRPILRSYLASTAQLVKIFTLHFILTWTEQITIFQYLSNLSFGPEPTPFETLIPDNGIEALLTHWVYLSALFFGTLFWTPFFGWVVYSFGRLASKVFNFKYSYWVRNFHFYGLTLVIAFTLTSFPYYNLDYLLTSPLGFIAQDDALKNVQLQINSVDLKKGRLGEYSSHTTLDTDVVPFDRARYHTTPEVEATFEDLNYQGEYIWRSRNDRLATGSPGMVNRFVAKFLPNLRSQQRLSLLLKLRKSQMGPVGKKALDDQDFESYTPFEEENDDLVKRFLGDYQAEVIESHLPAPYDVVDQDPYSSFAELNKFSFDALPYYEESSPDEFEERVGRKMRSKYYSNLVYKTILSVDISNFLNRQPKNYFLNKNEENDLFQKRLILANYYDSLRHYSRVPYSEPFKELFLGPKSYANRVYNSQFKGTLKIVRRLFSISLEDKYNKNGESVLKFDQPLFNEKLNKQNPILHEELRKNSSAFGIKRQTPFLKESDSIPFYAGWDEKLRKFIVTNYWLSYSDAGIKVDALKVFNNQNLGNKFANKKSNTIHFVTWPLSKKKIERLKYNSQKPVNLMFTEFDDPTYEEQRDLFEYAEAEDENFRLIYETLPSVVKRVDVRDKDKVQIYLRPLRGGIVWRGNDSLKLNLKDVLDLIKTKLRRDW